MSAPEGSAPPARPWRTYLYWGGLVAGAGLFIYQFWRGLAGLRALTLNAAAVGWLVLAVAAVAAADLVQITAWAYLIRGLGAGLPDLLETVRGYILSGLARYIPGGIWGVVSRGQWLQQAHAVPYRVSSTAAILEMGGLTGMAAVLAAAYWSGQTAWPLSGGLLALAVAGAAAVWIGPRLFARWPASAWLVRRGLLPSELAHLSLRRWALVLLAYGGVWIGLGLAVWFGAQALGAAPAAGLAGSAFVYALAYLAGLFFVLAPAGLGVRELALTSLLTSVLGLPGSIASAAAVLARFANLLAELFWAAVGTAAGMLKRRAQR